MKPIAIGLITLDFFDSAVSLPPNGIGIIHYFRVARAIQKQVNKTSESCANSLTTFFIEKLVGDVLRSHCWGSLKSRLLLFIIVKSIELLLRNRLLKTRKATSCDVGLRWA